MRGEFSFAGDLWADDMLWGQALRSPHPSARIRSIDIGPALAITGVHAVLTADDVPVNRYGLEHRDQPVLAGDIVRYAGEPVAVVAADHPDTARRACAAIVVDYEVLDPLVDPELADRRARRCIPTATCSAISSSAAATPTRAGPIVVEGTYEIGMQDQAFMGPEAGLATPTDDGGVDLVVSTQWLHNDRDQVAECLGLAARARAADARRRRRRVRRARRRQPAHPRVPARDAHRPAGEDRVLAGRVVPRPRAPPPGADLDAAHRASPTARS